MKRSIVGALALSWLVSGCAVFAPPEPCTSEWFDFEAREAFRPIRSDLRGALSQLEAAQLALQGPDPGLGVTVRVAFAANAGFSLIETLDRESLPRLRTAAAACDDPGFVRRAVFDFLDEEGVDELFTSADTSAVALGFAPMLERLLAPEAP